MIYRPSSDQVSQQFFKDLSRILTYLSTLSAPVIITGDINIRLDHLDHQSCRQFNDLIASFGPAQYVTQPTHDLGGILDAVATRSDLPAPDVSVIDVGLSDHIMVKWCLDLEKPTPLYETYTKRSWRGFNVDEFRSTLQMSQLCNLDFISSQTDVETTALSYNAVVTDILDRLAPPVETTRRKRKSDL